MCKTKNKARKKNPDEIYGISDISRLFGCSRFFGRDEKPAESDDDANASADAQGRWRAYRLQYRTTAKTANKECDNAEHLVITRRHTTGDEQLRVRHKLTPDRCQHDLANLLAPDCSEERAERSDALVVANCVFTRLPMMPCKPMLALISPKHAYVPALVHDGTSRLEATLPWWDFQRAIAPPIVKND